MSIFSIRTFLLLGLSTTAIGHAAQSQETSAGAEALVQQTVIVTGTRSTGRAALESSAPISVVSGEEISELGFGDLSRSLEYLEPSINYPRAATTATAANSRPITLRGLAPDQTLVLVNGKRRAATAILNINNAVGRGSAGVDLDLIPAPAIAQVEVLRDGAAAQYGSDAIAGVVNLILREADEGGGAFVQASTTETGDGDAFMAGGWAGFGLPGGGHLTLSGEYRDQEHTNRANTDQRFGRVTYQVGDPDLELATIVANAAIPVAGGEVYGFATLGRKDAINPAGFRTPAFAPAVYPDGFLPRINAVADDWSYALGWTGELAAGWEMDVSYGAGADRVEFSVSETVNASLGAASPTSFNSGAVKYEQGVTDLTLSRPIPDLMAGAHLAFGLQHRHEAYSSEEGDPEAFFGAGADGFAGFSPEFSGSRNAYAGFADFELNPFDPLLLTAAVRYDDYDDFGGATTWRASARFQIAGPLALRASLGSGFRAPSLQQQQFRLVSGALDSTGNLTAVGTLPVTDPVAQLLGARPLEAETSDNAGAGAVFTLGDLSVTADWFRIGIEDRIILSEQFGGAGVTGILTANGITNFQQVRFFSNAAETTTEGYEIAVRYRTTTPFGVDLDAALGYTHAQTELDALAPNTTLPALPYLQARSLLLLTEAQPEDKATFGLDLSRGSFGLQTHVSHFGTYRSAPFGNTLAQTWGEKTVLDASMRVDLSERVRIIAGVQNLGDVYPDQPAHNSLAPIIAATGGSFPTGEESPIGVNGRSWFVRLEAQF